MSKDFSASTTSLTTQPELSISYTETWHKSGAVLAQEHKTKQWEIADWILQGVENVKLLWPELPENQATAKVYDLAEKLFPQYSRITFRNWVYVARTFPASIRIDALTFSHYQTVLKVQASRPGPPPLNEDAEVKAGRLARETAETARVRGEWLAQAAEKGLSVSALRFAIANAFQLATSENTAATETKETEQPSHASAKVTPKREAGYSLPLPAEERKALETLAANRGISPATLAAHAVSEYIEAHSEELAEEASRREEIQAATNAARDFHETEIAQRTAWHNAQEEYKAARQALVNELEPLWRYVDRNNNRQLWVLGDMTREWLANTPKLPIAKLEDRVSELLTLLPPEPEQAETDSLTPDDTAGASGNEIPAGEPGMPAEPYVNAEQVEGLLNDPEWEQLMAESAIANADVAAVTSEEENGG